jgi:hypothetical protein
MEKEKARESSQMGEKASAPYDVSDLFFTNVSKMYPPEKQQ